jgi:hypothetical protein
MEQLFSGKAKEIRYWGTHACSTPARPARNEIDFRFQAARPVGHFCICSTRPKQVYNKPNIHFLHLIIQAALYAGNQSR